MQHILFPWNSILYYVCQCVNGAPAIVALSSHGGFYDFKVVCESHAYIFRMHQRVDSTGHFFMALWIWPSVRGRWCFPIYFCLGLLWKKNFRSTYWSWCSPAPSAFLQEIIFLRVLYYFSSQDDLHLIYRRCSSLLIGRTGKEEGSWEELEEFLSEFFGSAPVTSIASDLWTLSILILKVIFSSASYAKMPTRLYRSSTLY